ncbi:MAG: hypothetical protein AAGG75_25285 [Bacteroidota bacterium]
MNTLKAYLSLVEPQLLKHIQGQSKTLIELIKTQNFDTEDALIQRFCGKEYDRKYYENVKYRTLKILQALAIISGENSSNEVKKNLDLCRKNFTIGQKFLGNGKREEGLNLIRSAHRIAVKYDYTHMATELSSVLYHHYVYYGKNKQKAIKHGKQLLEYSQAYGAEKQAEYQFYSLIPYISGTLEPQRFKKAIDVLTPIACDSTKFIVHQAMIKILYDFSIDDYKMALKTCEDTLERLKARKGVYRSHSQFFHSKKGIAQIALGLYKEAKQSLVYAKRFAPPRSSNDYLLQFYLTLNALHAGEYEPAYQLYRKNRKCPFEDIRVQFAIIEAYLCFLAYTGYLSLEQNFRIGKFLNETIAAQSDKKGSNIAILIAELLIYLSRDRAKYIDRIETIKTYSYRYLRGRSTMRAKRFLKVLCMLPRCNFKAEAVKKLAFEHIDFINSHPIHFGDNAFLEIIPFDALLKIIFLQLNQKAA